MADRNPMMARTIRSSRRVKAVWLMVGEWAWLMVGELIVESGTLLKQGVNENEARIASPSTINSCSINFFIVIPSSGYCLCSRRLLGRWLDQRWRRHQDRRTRL